MTIKYLRDTLFVSHGISFENKGTYELPDEACKELHSTFNGYFELPKETQKEPLKVSTTATKVLDEEPLVTKKTKK